MWMDEEDVPFTPALFVPKWQCPFDSVFDLFLSVDRDFLATEQ